MRIPTQEEVGGKRCPDTYLFSPAILQEPQGIFEVMSFILKRKKKFAPLNFACHCLLLLFFYSDPYHTAVHTRVCGSYLSLTLPKHQKSLCFCFFYGTSE